MGQKVEEEKAEERRPNTNPYRHDDPHTQRLSDLWFSQRDVATIEQKDGIGRLYISKLLGLGDEVAKSFEAGDRKAFHQVGKIQSGSVGPDENPKSFWEGVCGLFPSDYTQEDVVLLTQHGGREGAIHLMIQLGDASPILHQLAVNAHCYK